MSRARRTRAAVALAALAIAALWLAPTAARASFGFLPGAEGFEATVTSEGGEKPNTAAGSHPYSMITRVNLKMAGEYTDGDLRDLHLNLPPGLIENPNVVTRCTEKLFSTPRSSPFESPSRSGESCPETSQIGIVTLHTKRGGGETRTFGVFNLAPPPGFPSRFGFVPYGIPVTITPHVRETGSEYGLTLDLKNFSQQLDVTGFELVVWGNPWGTSHNTQRGNCLNEVEPTFAHAKCPISDENPPHANQAYLTMPTSCAGPLTFSISATSWQQPATVSATSTTGGALQGCSSLPFNPVAAARLSTDRTSSPTGYDFTLDGNSVSLVDPQVATSSQVKKAVVTLPEGMTVNPSVASGLGTCSEAQFAAETVNSAPGAGCPNASKVGELTIESPLVEGQIEGSMFFATPFDNRFGGLLTLYMVAKKPERGIMVKVAGKAVPNLATGRLTATFDDLPQLPYSHFNVHFRAGQRSPLASPSACGTYATEIDTSPWRDPNQVLHQISIFNLIAGIGGGACPQPLAPFTPGMSAGTLNSNASSYSPLYLHLTRTDGEQEITSYSSTFPPGLLGKIAGIPFCPESLIEAAKHQTGAESATKPACPAASLIGHTYTGYGLGASLAYAPGTLYLAGPYNGSPLSVVAIDSAKVGPFDLGTVVIRSAIRVDRRTARVSLDSAGSDPIPHILAGFPLRLRDIRIYIDRPKFMLNPTSCAPFSLTSTLTGAGVRFSDPSDDSSATSGSPFQLANCSALNFGPRFKLSLKGGHRRSEYPSLKATVTPNPGDANIGTVDVNLPPKLFLAQEHQDTVCTLRQFAAHNCPKGSIYGRAKAVTPLLDEPMTGPVYLRSNGDERALPDLVAAISGRGVEVDVLGIIDSHLGGLRARFDVLPDAPVTKFTMSLRGGDKGIIVNATNTCAHPQVATTKFVGQDNGTEALRVPIKVACGSKKGGAGKKGRGKG